MGIDEVQTGRGAKVTEQPRLDMLDLERFAEQRIGVEINLSDGKIVGRAPVGIDLAQFFGSQWLDEIVVLGWGQGGYGSHRILPFILVLLLILVT